jgi:VWFA-related protein
MKKIIAAIVLAAGAAAGLSAQQPAAPPEQGAPPVTFRSEVNYVEVDATVTDAQGRVVSNLSADDFEIFEDGKAQKIAAFSLVDLPVERAEQPLFASTPIEPDVQSNDGGEGRIYLFVLDDLHTDPTRAPRVKAAARRFIEQNFGVNDLAAVVYTGGRAQDSQDFTNNRRLLLAAIDKFSGRKLRSETLQRIEGASLNGDTGSVEPGGDPDSQERAFRARSAMSTIRKLAEFMAGVRGRRKAMLLISEGVDYNIFDVIGNNPFASTSGPTPAPSAATAVLEDTRDAVAAATRGNVNIYAIDPRGLTTGDEDLITQSSSFPDQGVGSQSLQSELRLSQQSLRVLAADTGGFAAVNQNDFNAAFDRIVRENSTYYLIGYYPLNEKRDGKFRKLQVRVKGHPELTVHSRSGYAAPRGRVPNSTPAPANPKGLNPAITAAVSSPLPVAGLPMKVFAAPFKGTAPNAAIAVALEIDASKLDFVEQNGTYVEKIDVVNSATDVNGKIFPGERQTASLALKPETYARVKTKGFRILSQVNLPPGRYQLRVAAGNANGKAGSVVYDLVVPDFSKAPLTMSGIALTSTTAAQTPTVRPKDPLADLLPGPVTTERTFATSDTISLFGEVYENLRGGQTHMIDITTELRAEGGRVVRTSSEQRSSSELQGTSGGYGFNAQLPLNDVAPGLYVIHVEGKSSAGNEPAVSRDIQIRVQ